MRKDSKTAMEFGARLRQERLRCHLSQEALAEVLGISPKSISRWEQGRTIPQASTRLQLSRFFGLSPEDLFTDREAQMSPPLLWSVPYPRNPFFTGRKEILHHLHEQLNQEHTMALTQSWAITGLGGIGKTQIALEYAYQYRQDYRFVFWTNAATQEILLADLVAIANLLQLPERDEQDQKKVLLAVKQWFAAHQNWLWILDNIDDLALVWEVIPTERPGYLLLTSRAQAQGTLAQRIEVEIMAMAEGTLFLLRRAKLLAPNASLDHASQELLAGAEAIVIEMDFLPLALDQAGAYIEEIGCSLSTYLELYRARRKELLQRRGHIPTDHPESVATTWFLSFQRIEQTNPAAADLLRLCAFLEPDAIPEELISEGSVYLSSVLASVVTDALRLNEAIEELRRFSLVQRHPETRQLQMHRLVQAVFKDAMDRGVQRQWAQRAIQVTNSVFPEQVEMATWPRCRRYLPQAQACSVLIQDYAFTFGEAASLLSRTATYLREYALYEQAEPLYQRALRIQEQALGPDHFDLAFGLYNLAELYRAQGKKYGQAESLYQRALGIQEKTLGPDHLDLADPLNGLATLYRGQGKYEQAEPLCQKALYIREKTLGPDHLDLANPLIGLARLFYRQGKYEQAEPLFQRALHIREQRLGSDHLDVAAVLNSLAVLYTEQGKYEQVESLYQKVLHIREQILGFDHPEVAAVLNNLADFYTEQGKYERAEPLIQRALRIWECTLNPDHMDVTFGLESLAALYTKQGKYEQVEPLYQKALHIREQTMGSNHPMVANLLNGLANLCRAQRRDEQAELLYQRALHIWEHVQGPRHPDMAETLHDLALFREVQGSKQEAASWYQRELIIRELTLGPLHPKTVAAQMRYGELLAVVGQHNDSATL